MAGVRQRLEKLKIPTRKDDLDVAGRNLELAGRISSVHPRASPVVSPKTPPIVKNRGVGPKSPFSWTTLTLSPLVDVNQKISSPVCVVPKLMRPVASPKETPGPVRRFHPHPQIPSRCYTFNCHLDASSIRQDPLFKRRSPPSEQLLGKIERLTKNPKIGVLLNARSPNSSMNVEKKPESEDTEPTEETHLEVEAILAQAGPSPIGTTFDSHTPVPFDEGAAARSLKALRDMPAGRQLNFGRKRRRERKAEVQPPKKRPFHARKTKDHFKPCNCKKSRCLKLYCECFARQVDCNGCNCVGCNNNSKFEDVRAKAVATILDRDPNAFFRGSQTGMLDDSTARHRKGCHCKKSHCLKKYCECFQAGVSCSSKCKCAECQNDRDGERAAAEKAKPSKGPSNPR